MVLDTFLNLLYHGSYLAVFITSFISSSSILIPVLPFPSYFPVLVAVGIGLNPLLAGLVGGFGSALGETIGYFAGLGGSAAIEKFEKKVPRFLKRFEKIYSNMGFWLILICAFLPFPFDIVGVLSGASKYDFKKFMVALVVGRVSRTVLIAYAGSLTVPIVAKFILVS